MFLTVIINLRLNRICNISAAITFVRVINKIYEFFLCRGWIIGTEQIELTYLQCNPNIIAMAEGLIVIEYHKVLSTISSDESINA